MTDAVYRADGPFRPGEIGAWRGGGRFVGDSGQAACAPTLLLGIDVRLKLEDIAGLAIERRADCG
jgi:hypothetical protein